MLHQRQHSTFRSRRASPRKTYLITFDPPKLQQRASTSHHQVSMCRNLAPTVEGHGMPAAAPATWPPNSLPSATLSPGPGSTNASPTTAPGALFTTLPQLDLLGQPDPTTEQRRFPPSRSVGTLALHSSASSIQQHVPNRDGIPTFAARERERERERVERSARRAFEHRLPRNRGAHAREPLSIDTLPSWRREWPQSVASAADAFDRRHRRRWDSAEGVLHALGRDLTHATKDGAFADAVLELRRNRYLPPVERDRQQQVAAVPLPGNASGSERVVERRPPRPRTPWQLDRSIWRARPQGADSRSFWDTEECERAALETDWRLAIDCGLGRFIQRVYGDRSSSSSRSGSSSSEVDADGEGDTGEDEDAAARRLASSRAEAHAADDVKEVLWRFRSLFFRLFDYYAALGPLEDVTHVSSNAFKAFLTDCQLRGRIRRPAQLFVLVDASSVGRGHRAGGHRAARAMPTERHNRKRALSRQEFVHALVRYTLSGALNMCYQ